MKTSEMRQIAIGNTAEIYERDGQVLKVYPRHDNETVQHEANNQEYARAFGLPVPNVVEMTEVDGRPAIVMERARLSECTNR